jgi:Transposase DDE domain group 1
LIEFRLFPLPRALAIVMYKSFWYQAGSRTQPRRIVAKVEHHADELFPCVGFIVTNLRLPGRAVVRFYNKRGTAERWIKEGKQTAHRPGCHRIKQR